jgi:tellurite resistance protein TehA-like permease
VAHDRRTGLSAVGTVCASGAPESPAALTRPVAELNPGSFALVMATGIVSVGMYHHGLRIFSAALLWIGTFCYVVLAVLTLVRMACSRGRLQADLGDPSRAFGSIRRSPAPMC